MRQIVQDAIALATDDAADGVEHAAVGERRPGRESGAPAEAPAPPRGPRLRRR